MDRTARKLNPKGCVLGADIQSYMRIIDVSGHRINPARATSPSLQTLMYDYDFCTFFHPATYFWTVSPPTAHLHLNIS